MAKLCIEATNLLKFCMAGSDGLDLALGAGVGSMYIGSGLFWGWQWHLDPNIWGLGEG